MRANRWSILFLSLAIGFLGAAASNSRQWGWTIDQQWRGPTQSWSMPSVSNEHGTTYYWRAERIKTVLYAQRGKCSVDGKVWWPTRADGACYSEDDPTPIHVVQPPIACGEDWMIAGHRYWYVRDGAWREATREPGSTWCREENLEN